MVNGSRRLWGGTYRGTSGWVIGRKSFWVSKLVCIHVCVCVCVCMQYVCMNVYICMHVYMHTNQRW
jgi:hypothetical protein